MKTKSIRKKITGGMCAVALPVCVLQLSANPAEAACGAHPDGVNDYYMCNTKEEALSLCENTPTPTQGVDPGGSWSCSWSGWNGEDGYRGIGLYDLNGDGNKTQRFVAWFAAESGFVDPSPPIPTPNNGPCGCELTNPCDANPIRISTGNKYEEVTDSSSGGIMPLVIKRSYNSELKGWRFNGVASLNIKANSILYASDGGKGITLTESGGIWSTPDQPGVELTFNTEESLWVLVDQTLTRRKFDESGMLVLIENSQGVTHSLTYDTDGRLLTISRSLGGSLAYQYNNVGLITNITTESGATYDYTYSGVNLITVGYPGGAQINYHYEDSRHYYALTGVTNELGDRFSTWAYELLVGRYRQSMLAALSDLILCTTLTDRLQLQIHLGRIRPTISLKLMASTS
jgi:YD repeat-containing protein